MDSAIGVVGITLLAAVLMMAFAYMVVIVAVRFMPYERARKLAVLLVAAIAIPILLPFGTWRYGLAFLAGVALLAWQLSLRELDGGD